MTAYIGLAALVCATGACTDVRTSQPATPLEREAALGLVRQLAALSIQPEDASELLAATDATPIVTLLAPEGTPMPVAVLAVDSDSREMRAGCVNATPTSATFNLCEIGSHAVEGTWSVEGHRVHAELVDVFVLGPELHGSVAVETHIDLGIMSRPMLSGAFDANIMWSMDEEDFVLDASLRIDDLLLDGPDCASGGSITISGTLGDGARNTTSLWFGPGCSDIQIAR